MQSAGAYATFSDAYGGFSYRAGLRFQWDQVAYKSAPQEAMTRREHGRWFPELSLAYTFNETKGTLLNLDVSSYSGDLPYGMEILPKRKRISEYSYSIGNPLLNPYRGFSLDLTYTLRGRWTFNYYFSKDQDIAKNFSFYDPEDPRVIYTKPMNAGTSYSHYLGVEVDTPITKWMRLSAYVSGKMGRDFYALGEEHYSTEHKSMEFHGTLIFEPIKTLRINVRGSYRSKQQWSPELWLNADYSLSADIQKSFFKGRLVATFAYYGILYNDGIFTTKMSDGSYFATSREASSPRRWWNLKLSFRFNHKATKSISAVSASQSL